MTGAIVAALIGVGGLMLIQLGIFIYGYGKLSSTVNNHLMTEIKEIKGYLKDIDERLRRLERNE